MSNFTSFNHKPLINPAYQESIQYDSLRDIPFKKLADLYKFAPEMVYSIKVMYRSTSDYGDQIIAIVKPESNPPESETMGSFYQWLAGEFRLAFPHKFVDVINVDDPGLISDCNNGLARFRITQYHSKRFNKDLNGIEFI